MFRLMRKLLALVPGIKRPMYITALYKVIETCFIGVPFGILILALRDILVGTLTIQAVGCYTLGLAVCFVAQGVLNYLGIRIAYPVGTEICEQLRLNMGNHLKNLPMSYFSKETTGSLNSLVSNELKIISLLPRMAFPQFVSAMVLPVILAPFLFYIDWRLAVVSLAVIPVSIPLLQRCRSVLNGGLRKRSASLVGVSEKIIEYIQGMEVVKGFNQTGERFESFRQALSRFKNDNLRLAFKATPVMMAFNAVLDLGFVLILLCGAHLFLGGEINLLTFLTFLILGLRMYEPVKALGGVYEIVQSVEVSLERVDNLLRSPVLPQPDKEVLPDGADVEFRQVNFSYGDTPVLRDVSFTVPERSLTALVGPSGAGKTTITRLMARFWDVESGQIVIGGQDVRNLRTETLFSRLSMIFQDVYLLKDTIFANIAYGSPDATCEQVEAAARAAQSQDFIAALPQGYETMVGEGGATLSGGEKQRISIARAILKNAPIILLDEATAAIDPENEFLIQQAIDNLARSKTMIVITHKLSTVTGADQIIVLDGRGGIADRGTHKELLARTGIYRSLWEKQQDAIGWQPARTN